MFFTPENMLLIGAVIWFASILLSKTGYRFGVPVLLVFLLIGMMLGGDGLGISFDNYKYAPDFVIAYPKIFHRIIFR